MAQREISKAQIKLIHVGRRKLGLSDEEYGDILFDATGKRSCLGMTAAEAKAAIEALERAGFNPRSPRPAGTATAAQVALVKALWREAARMPSENYLSVWLLNTYRVDRPEDLTFDDASRAIEALKAMKRRATHNAKVEHRG